MAAVDWTELNTSKSAKKSYKAIDWANVSISSDISAQLDYSKVDFKKFSPSSLDDINEKLFVKGSRNLAKEVLEVDSKVVDGVVNLTGLVTLGSGEGLKYFETGRAQFYALIVFGGVILLVAIFGFHSPQVS